MGSDLVRHREHGAGGHNALNYSGFGDLRCVNYACSTGSYLYDAMDERALAIRNNQTWTAYVYLNGQPMAELDNTGKWTDYIYANGQKIAKVDSMKPIFHMHGVRDSNTQNLGCGVIPLVNDLSTKVAGQTVQPGDEFVFDVKQQIDSGGALSTAFVVTLTDGGAVGTDADKNGQVPGLYTLNDGQWHHSVSVLSPGLFGRTMGSIAAGPAGYPYTTLGTWDIWIANAGLVHKDGTFTPIYTGQPASVPGVATTCGGSQQTFQTELTSMSSADAALIVGTDYFLSDHLGTTQMELSAGGWPVWEGAFTPFGEQILNGTVSNLFGPHPDGSDMPFKFTGKERDTESGLDYFGARYYASSMGRWMSPDWSAKEEPVPYAKLDDPQSLNLYGYVGNNPLSRADADGHDWLGELISYIAVHVATSGIGISSTRAGYNAAAKQATSPAARDALKTEYRGKGPALGRALADNASKDPARIAARAAKTDAELAATVGKTSSGANAFAETAGVVGKGAAGLAVGVAVYDVATAPPGQRAVTAAGEGGGLAGAFAGGEAGAEGGAIVGSFFGPGPGTAIGAAIGGIGGAIVGGIEGKKAGTAIYNDATKKPDQ